MKIGFLSDAHGNLLAIKKCIHFLESQKVEKLYFLGDAISYFPDGLKILSFLMEKRVHILKGNHEAMMLGELPLNESKDKVYRIGVLRENVDMECEKFITSLKPRYSFTVDGFRVLLTHAGPEDNLLHYVYPDTKLDSFKELPYDVFFMGHTHRPFVKKEFGKTIVNVGSCGLPRDVGNLLSCCVWDTCKDLPEIFRIKIDRSEIINKYQASTHTSVLALLDRESDEFVGTLVE